MAFTKETIRNEILLRFGEVGEQRDKLVGALQRSLEQVLEDGVIISSKALDPEQLSALPGQDGTPLADVLGEVTAQTIIDNQKLTEALADAGAVSAQLQIVLSQSQEDLAEAHSILDQMQAEITDKDEVLTASQAEVQRLTDLLNQAAVEASAAQMEIERLTLALEQATAVAPEETEVESPVASDEQEQQTTVS